MKTTLKRIDVLQRIYSCFHQLTQWYPWGPSDEHFHAAEALIELLEIEDCGSVGGFDPSNPLHPWPPNGMDDDDDSPSNDFPLQVEGFELWNRFVCLLRKNNDFPNIHPSCGFTLRRLSMFFDKARGLREKCLRLREQKY